MNATCPSCGTIFRVDPAKVPEGGVRARCSVCRTVFAVGVPEPAVAKRAPAAPVGVAAPVEAPAREAAASWTLRPRAPAEPEPEVAAGESAAATAAAWLPPRRVEAEPEPAAPPVAVPVEPPVAAPVEPPVAAPVAPPVAAPLAPRVFVPAVPRVSTPVLPPAAAPPRPLMPGAPPAPFVRPYAAPPFAAPAVRPRVVPPAAAPMEPVAAQPPTPAADTAPPAEPPTLVTPGIRVGPAAGETRTTIAGTPGRIINPFLVQDPLVKARRLARALISDMVSYHPAKRAQGLKDGTLKDIFREEIKKSYEEYVVQVGEGVANSTSHFQDALNEILAGGQKLF